MKVKSLAIASIAIAMTASLANARPERGGGHERPDPEELVISIVSEYDANADNLINAAELESALIGLREKRMAMRPGPAGEREGDGERPRLGRDGGERERPTPAMIAEHMIERFDEDGDEALNTEELLGAVDAMHKGPRGMRGHRGPRGGPGLGE